MSERLTTADWPDGLPVREPGTGRAGRSGRRLMAIAAQALRLLGARLGRPRPLYAHYGVTHRCTQRCRMCVVWKSARPEAELSVAQVEHLAGELHGAGVRHVALGGGEPFVRPDVAGLVAAFASRGISVRLLTNGVGVPVERIEEVLAAGLEHVSISLDSLDPAVEREIYSGREVWQGIVDTMRLFWARLPRRAQPIMNVCVSRLNLAELPRLVSFAAGEGFACSFVPIALAASEPESDGFAAHAPDMAVRPQEREAVVAAYTELLRLKRSGAPVANSSRFLRDSMTFLAEGRCSWHCDAGELYFSISPEGAISICHHFAPFAAHDDAGLAASLAGAARRRQARARRAGCPGCMRPCWAEVTHAVRDLPSTLEAARLLLLPPRNRRERKGLMRVWLVNPRTDDMITTELPEYVSKEVGRFPPLGLLSLAAYVRARRGDELRVLDLPAEELTYDRLAEQVRSGAPDVVGITGTTHNLVEIKRAAARVKTARPQAVVVLGGPHVEAFPREATELPGVDFTVRGEGEIPFTQLLDALDSGDLRPSIPGLGLPDGDDVVLHEPGAAPEDLDALPYPARDLVDPARYYYVLGKRSTFTTILSTRGCPYRCIFCSTPRGSYRMRSPRHILDEVESCLAAGAREFHFIDDTFNAARGRLGAVSEEILRRGLAIHWSFRGRVDTLTEEEIVLARRSGCQRMHVGIENGSDEGLRLLRKGITTAQVERALIWARRHGITSAAYFLIGCPHQKTREDILRTIDFACRVDPDFALFNILTIYPHTELHDQAVARGLIGAEHWRDFARNPDAGFRLRFWEEHFSQEELVALLETAYRRFYMRPRVIWRNLRALGSIGELRHKAAAGLSLLRGPDRRGRA